MTRVDAPWQATGASITHDGDCWQHSHPNILNVYDFTLWTVAADTHFDVGSDTVASPNYLRSFALAGEVMYQWPQQGSEHWDTGNLGDSGTYWRKLNADYSKLGSKGFEDYQVLLGACR